MPLSSKRFLAFLAMATLLAGRATAAQQAAQPAPNLDFPTVLYGAAYYNEYSPGDPR